MAREDVLRQLPKIKWLVTNGHTRALERIYGTKATTEMSWFFLVHMASRPKDVSSGSSR